MSIIDEALEKIRKEPPPKHIQELIKQAKLQPYNIFIIKSKLHSIGPEPSAEVLSKQNSIDKKMLGFGGSGFAIYFLNGSKIITHNLWVGPDIPSEYIYLFPETSKVLKIEGI